jgi:hypothetical protein
MLFLLDVIQKPSSPVGHLRCHDNDPDFPVAAVHLPSKKIRPLLMKIII